MGFSRQEYWSGLPFLPAGDLLHLGVEPGSLTLQAAFLSLSQKILIIGGLLRELTLAVFIPDSQSKEGRKSRERQLKERIFGVLALIGTPKSEGPLLFSSDSYTIGQRDNCKEVCNTK